MLNILRDLRSFIKRDLRKVAEAAVAVDMRNLTFEVKEWRSSHLPVTNTDINAIINGQTVGYLEFSVEDDEQIVEIDSIEVEEEYKNLGIGIALYREFGKLYDSKYSGWGVARTFVNPVAEYAFRKAVSLGWVSESALTEEHINRFYSEEEEELAKDLRKKLPEHTQGPETWANRQDLRKIMADAAPVELRNISTNSEIVNVEEDDDEEYYYYGATYKITALVNGEEAGYLNFVETRTRADGVDDHFLYLAKIEVENKYREHGIGTLLYKEFGTIYAQKFSGWEVERHFENPVAEYAFKRAIELGYVSASAFTEERTTRDYSEEQQRLWNEKLQPKLTSAGLKDLRRVVGKMNKLSAILDLRKSNQPKPDNVTDMSKKELAPNVIDMRRKEPASNVLDLRNINKPQYDTLDDYYKETGFKPQANLRDLRRAIGASAIKELRKLKK